MTGCQYFYCSSAVKKIILKGISMILCHYQYSCGVESDILLDIVFQYLYLYSYCLWCKQALRVLDAPLCFCVWATNKCEKHMHIFFTLIATYVQPKRVNLILQSLLNIAVCTTSIAMFAIQTDISARHEVILQPRLGKASRASRMFVWFSVFVGRIAVLLYLHRHNHQSR